MRIYNKEQLDKLGNAIIYLADRMSPLSKTKVLKLIYLLEEISIKKYGVPFFNLKFDVWKLGPVSRDLFVELSTQPVMLDAYIKRVVKEGNTYIESKLEFVDDEFNDLEMNVLDFVVEKFKNSSAKDLIDITHRKHSLWYLTAKSEGILDFFEKDQLNSTDIELDMSKLLEENSFLKAYHNSHKEFLEQSQNLKF